MKQNDVLKSLPEHWRYFPRDNYILITAISSCGFNLGNVTVDLRHRRLTFGVIERGRRKINKKYVGKGWKYRLIKDAIKRLKDVI